MFISAPCLYFGVSQPPDKVWQFMGWVGVGVMFMYVYYAGVYAAIQDVVEPGLRATAMALYFFVMYVLGGAFGTYVLGRMSDWFAIQKATAAGQSLVGGHVPEQFRAIGLHEAMYVVPVFCCGLAIVLFAASRTVVNDMRKLRDWYDSEAAITLQSRVSRPCGRVRTCSRHPLAPLFADCRRPLISGSVPSSMAHSNCAIGPANASGNQASLHFGRNH